MKKEARVLNCANFNNLQKCAEEVIKINRYINLHKNKNTSRIIEEQKIADNTCNKCCNFKPKER